MFSSNNSWRGNVDEKKILQSQPAITCSKLTIKTLEEGVKYV